MSKFLQIGVSSRDSYIILSFVFKMIPFQGSVSHTTDKRIRYGATCSFEEKHIVSFELEIPARPEFNPDKIRDHQDAPSSRRSKFHSRYFFPWQMVEKTISEEHVCSMKIELRF